MAGRSASTPTLAAALASGVVASVLAVPAAVAVAGGDSGSAQARDLALTLDDCTIVGTDYGEYLTGTDGDDVICGLGGDDKLISSPGDDVFVGGDGNDGVSFVYTDVTTGVRADLLAGVATGQGNDTLDGIENLFGSPYKDTLLGDNGTYTDSGGAITGNLLVGYGRGDTINGRGGGMDVLDGGSGNDVLIPGPGDDQAIGGNNIDTISFKFASGPVTVDITVASATGEGNDYVLGENVIGSRYDDVITGGTEGYGRNTHTANTLAGQAGDDVLNGGPLGNDKLLGQAGDDTLDGGTETDLCDGGSGVDTAANCETLVSIP